MRPVILYRDDVDWRQESSIASKYFKCINSRSLVESGDLVIARFSALPFYNELELDVNTVGAELINTHEQHRYIADLGNWYYDLCDYTPQTWNDVSIIPDNGPFILKGETNSKKFYWKTHMFAADKKAAIQVQTNLLQDSLLQYQKIYVRKYIKLEELDEGLQGLPITREYRFFIYKKNILSGGFYWSSHYDDLCEKGMVLNPDEVPRDFLNTIIDKIQNTELCFPPPNYYVIDVAKTDRGDWIVIELNDGQMSGLSENTPEVLYMSLKNNIVVD